MGKIIKKVAGFVSKVAPIVAAVFPPLAPIAMAAGTVAKAISTADAIFKQGFPKGLLTGALAIGEQFFPGPLKAVKDAIGSAIGKGTELLEAARAVLPEAVRNFIPENTEPTVAKGMAGMLA